MSSALSQMRRLDELEAHYAVKQRELQAIQREIAERTAKLEDTKSSAAATSSGASSPSSSESEVASSPSSSAASSPNKKKKDSANVPAVGHCSIVMQALKDRKNVEYLPLYEAHNVSSALRAAIDVEKQTIANMKRDINTLTTEYQQTVTRMSKASNQLADIKRETGYNEHSWSAKQKAPPQVKNSSSSSQQQQASSQPTSARQNQHQETEAAKGEREKKEVADAYILQLRKVEEHLKASRLLQKKLESSLKELDRAGLVQHETEMKVDEAQNDVLVLDRKIHQKQGELLDLRELQGGCDKEMEKIDARRVKEHGLIERINNDFRKVKNEAADVSEQRRQWEETIKAQDRRLAELRERKEMIDQAVEAQGWKSEVQQFVENVTAQRQSEQSSHHPSPSNDLSDIISHYADVNMLSPPEEVIPGGVVMLLTSLKDRLAHRVRCKEVLLDEKKSSGIALQERVEELVAEHHNSDNKLYTARVDCERQVLENVEQAQEALLEFRDEYNVVKGISLARQRKDRKESIKRVAEEPARAEMKFKEKKQK